MTLTSMIDTAIGTPDALRVALSRMIESGEAQNLVAEILVDQSLLGEVAERSYAHANGFDKMVLLVGPSGQWKLRAHIWPEVSELDDLENVHNHRWDFASSVFAGELEATYYDVSFGTTGELEAFEYFSPETSSNYKFRHTASAKSTVTGREILEPRYIYSLSWHRYHRVRLLTGPAVSLVLQGPVRQPSTSVLRIPASLPVVTTVTRMSPSRVVEHLQLLVRLLSDKSS